MKNVLAIVGASLLFAAGAEPASHEAGDAAPQRGLLRRSAMRAAISPRRQIDAQKKHDSQVAHDKYRSLVRRLQIHATIVAAKEDAYKQSEAMKSLYDKRVASSWKSLQQARAEYLEASAKLTKEDLERAIAVTDEDAFSDFINCYSVPPQELKLLMTDVEQKLEAEYARDIALTKKRLEELRAAVEFYKASHEGKLPVCFKPIIESENAAIKESDCIDAWNSEFVLVVRDGKYCIVSPGPDRIRMTKDDLHCGEIEPPTPTPSLRPRAQPSMSEAPASINE